MLIAGPKMPHLSHFKIRISLKNPKLSILEFNLINRFRETSKDVHSILSISRDFLKYLKHLFMSVIRYNFREI